MTKLVETKFLFDKIKRLYPTFQMPDEIDIDCWTDILRGYSQEDILKALKAYRKTVEYNTAPTPATFAKFLHEEAGSPKQFKPVITDNKTDDPKDWHTFWNIDPALSYYMRDCANKPSNEVHGLIFYRRALQDIIIEKVDTLPFGAEKPYSDKIALIRINGWDGDLSERAEYLANLALNRTRAEQVDGFKQAGFLASRWSA